MRENFYYYYFYRMVRYSQKSLMGNKFTQAVSIISMFTFFNVFSVIALIGGNIFKGQGTGGVKLIVALMFLPIYLLNYFILERKGKGKEILKHYNAIYSVKNYKLVNPLILIYHLASFLLFAYTGHLIYTKAL